MDLGIDFRKLVRDDNNSGYKSTCANEEIVDGTGSLRTGQLAHELSTKGFWVGGPGLGRIWPGLVPVGQPRSCMGRAWAAPGASRPWAASLVPRLGCWPGSPELAGGRAGRRRGWPEKKRRRKKEGKRKKKRREKRKERVSGEGERRGRKKKKRGSGFNFELKSRLYSASGFSYKHVKLPIYPFTTRNVRILHNPSC